VVVAQLWEVGGRVMRSFGSSELFPSI
jgi:hypothetical protein